MDNQLNEIRKRISDRKEELGMSYQELADKTGLSKSTLQRYITGDIGNLGLDKLEIIASALNTSPAKIMGWEKDVDKLVENGTNRQEMAVAYTAFVDEKDITEILRGMKEKGASEKEIQNVISAYNILKEYKESALNIVPTKNSLEEESTTVSSNIRIVELDRNVVRIPVVGRIPAGVPAEAIEDILSYEEIPADWTRGDNRYIGLVVEGDSMYPKYIEGDIVIIRLQQDCESGQDCACYVNGYDATLKTVKKGDGKITLTPVNTAYSPRTYVHPGEVEILGVVKELRRKF